MSLTQLLITALVLALLIWRLRARWKSYVGRQRFSAKRAVSHLAVFGLATLVVAALARRHFEALESFGGGIVLGAALAIVGLVAIPILTPLFLLMVTIFISWLGGKPMKWN